MFKPIEVPLSSDNCPENDNPLTLEVMTVFGVNPTHPQLTRLQLGRGALSDEELLEAADERLLDLARQTHDVRLAHPAVAVTALQLCMEHQEPVVEIAARSLRTDARWSPRWVALDSPGHLYLTEGVQYDTAVVPTYSDDLFHCHAREYVHYVSVAEPGVGLQGVVHLARQEDGVGPIFFGVTGTESVHPG